MFYHGESVPTRIRPVRRPASAALPYRDAGKNDMKAGNINPSTWEATGANKADDDSGWRQVIKEAVH